MVWVVPRCQLSIELVHGSLDGEERENRQKIDIIVGLRQLDTEHKANPSQTQNNGVKSGWNLMGNGGLVDSPKQWIAVECSKYSSPFRYNHWIFRPELNQPPVLIEPKETVKTYGGCGHCH